MYGMTILVPSLNLPVDGSGCLLVFCWGLPCYKSVLGSGSLVGFCEGHPFLLQEIQV